MSSKDRVHSSTLLVNDLPYNDGKTGSDCSRAHTLIHVYLGSIWIIARLHKIVKQETSRSALTEYRPDAYPQELGNSILHRLLTESDCFSPCERMFSKDDSFILQRHHFIRIVYREEAIVNPDQVHRDSRHSVVPDDLDQTSPIRSTR